MNSFSRGARAYQAAADVRNLRQQEADVFRRATGALRSCRNGRPLDQVRALADNRRLWLTVTTLMRDPTNALPAELRAGIISLGLAVDREMDKPSPSIDFLIGINESIVDGLCGVA
jgi:flagellar biosynthesis regulator FlaF